MKKIKFTPRASIKIVKPNNMFCVCGEITIDVLTASDDFIGFMKHEHEELYDALKEFGTWEIIERN